MGPKKAKKTTTIGIYWRKLLFFALLFAAIFVVWKIIEGSKFFADIPEDQSAVTYVTTSDVNLEVKEDGSVYKNQQKIKAKVTPQNDFDELRLIVYDQNGFFLDRLRVNLKLPAAVAARTKPEILAIHGVGSSSASVADSSTISYEANSVSATATITIVAKIPKDVINLPLYDRIVFLLSTFGGTIWLVLAIIVPILALIYLILLFALHQKSSGVPAPERAISGPPMALPPAVVGVLLSQKVGPREIAATLIDLSLRGYIFVIDRDRGFAFGKRNFAGQLLPFEKVLLSKIFRNSLKTSEEQIDERFANHLYSHKMSLFGQEIYSLATRLGYFKENPIRMHRRYQFIGTLLFFLALAFFFLTFKYFPTLPYAVFLWVGMMVAAIIIIIVGSKMPIRTAAGRQALSNWLAFKKYLSAPEPLPYDARNYRKFVEYLPYAIVFQAEANWAKRFSGEEFAVPDWFLTDKMSLGLSDFCLALYPIIGYVGQHLASIREPGYK